MNERLEENLLCDICESIITDSIKDSFHYTGIVFNKMNQNIILCKKCHKLIKVTNFDKIFKTT